MIASKRQKLNIVIFQNLNFQCIRLERNRVTFAIDIFTMNAANYRFILFFID